VLQILFYGFAIISLMHIVLKTLNTMVSRKYANSHEFYGGEQLIHYLVVLALVLMLCLVVILTMQLGSIPIKEESLLWGLLALAFLVVIMVQQSKNDKQIKDLTKRSSTKIPNDKKENNQIDLYPISQTQES